MFLFQNLFMEMEETLPLEQKTTSSEHLKKFYYRYGKIKDSHTP